MSSKLPLSNSFKTSCEPIHWSKAPSTDVNVKFAGEEAKDRLYEPKHKKKVVRVLTVVAYIFFVSLAAIMLSLYYVFIWNGHQKENTRLRTVVVPITTKCDNDFQALLVEPTINSEEPQYPTTGSNEENSTWLPDIQDFETDNDYRNERIFMKKLFGDQKVMIEY